MEIPKNIICRNRRYKFIKEYPGFILYQDIETGIREAFKRSDLGMVEETTMIYTGYHTKYRKSFHKKNQW